MFMGQTQGQPGDERVEFYGTRVPVCIGCKAVIYDRRGHAKWHKSIGDDKGARLAIGEEEELYTPGTWDAPSLAQSAETDPPMEPLTSPRVSEHEPRPDRVSMGPCD